MEFCPNFTSVAEDPADWARAREAEGYPVISVADHLSVPWPHPHLWVTATTFALSTRRIRVMSAFSNNLFRSPVEFAHASLALQRVSGGRFEAGLGAGWAEPEIGGLGWEFPAAPERASRYIEALQIAREVLHTGKCAFTGEHYRIDIADIGPLGAAPPRLVASCAGPRTLRGAAPHVDSIELMGFSMHAQDFAARMLRYSEDDLRKRVELARQVAPDKPLGFLVLCAAGDDPQLQAQAEAMGGGLFAGFVGPTERVAANLRRLGELGIDRVQLAPTTPGTLSHLAPFLNSSS